MMAGMMIVGRMMMLRCVGGLKQGGDGFDVIDGDSEDGVKMCKG